MTKYIPQIPMALFALYFIKVAFFTINFPEACVLGVLGATACYFQFKHTDAKISALETKVEAAIKFHDDKTKEIQTIKEAVNGIKLANFSRPINKV